MKHIGIVDITTVGACICVNAIVAKAALNDSSGKHPEFTMHAFSFDKYKKLVIEKNWDGLGDLILQSINILKKAGADLIIIPSNTPHFAIKKIQKYSPLPVVNLIELVADECKKRGFTTALILGTKSTMQEGLYDQLLKDRKITPIVPDNILCNEIDNLIMNEIIPSTIKQSSVDNISNKIKKIDCDVAILGCTELPEVYSEKNLGIPVIDTTRLLAYAALDMATAQLKEEKVDINDSINSKSLGWNK